MLLVTLAWDVRFAGRLPVRDRSGETPAAWADVLGLLGRPHRLHAHPHPDLVVRDPFDALLSNGRVRAVEEEVREDVVLLLLLSLVLDRRDHREGRNGCTVGDVDLVRLVGDDRAQRTEALRRNVGEPARRTLVSGDPSLAHQLVEAARDGRRDDLVVQVDLLRHELHGLGHNGSKHSMSVMLPSRCARQRTFTRSPLATRPSTACNIDVSAPSSFTSAHANGRCSGCLRIGCSTHVACSTTPESDTSTSSLSTPSPVSGSYSSGGQRTWPSFVREPRTLPSRSAVKKAPMTGPRLRLYGNSRVKLGTAKSRTH